MKPKLIEIPGLEKYWINKAGKVFHEKAGKHKEIKPCHTNCKDRQLSVCLKFENGNGGVKKYFPLRYLVLNAFQGKRPKFVKCFFKDRDYRNCDNSNLYWDYDITKISMMDILESSVEFKIYEQAIKKIKLVHKIHIYQDRWIKRFVRDYNKIDNRINYFRKLFKI